MTLQTCPGPESALTAPSCGCSYRDLGQAASSGSHSYGFYSGTRLLDHPSEGWLHPDDMMS